jgi:ABC-2 type transport system permease protein
VSLWLIEWRLLVRSRLAVAAALMLALLAAAAVASGMAEVARQRAVIQRIQPQQVEDVSAIVKWAAPKGDPGDAAYYTFHATWDPPSDLAFAALGFRDVAPYVLRVRALGLEAQLYEGEQYNPELALAGRFDWAFVLVYLAPLFVIALFHDLISGEREAGRLRVLEATAGGSRRLWWRRGLLRFALLWVAVALPFLVGAALSGAGALAVAAAIGLAGLYIAFWTVIAVLVGRAGRSSVANAATLAASWLVLTLVLPAVAQVAISAAVPVRQGVELTLAQREQVHRAWDIPKAETMRRFFASHPQWADTAPLGDAFHWKWYFAFHEVGDEAVAPQVAEYRRRLAARDRATSALGWFLPPVGVQAALAGLANTDLKAQLAYQDRVRDYHRRLRKFYYPYLFRDRPFGAADYARAPRFAS